MATFLQQVARHYFPADKLCFIFPNRRALVFFRKAFAEQVAGNGRPVLCPQLCTINDFFYTTAGATPTDQVHLLLTLYDCYRALNPKAETLDEFIYWGEVLLSDFNDTDKYLVAPEQLFTNIADFRSLQDNFDYLEPVQQAALERFLRHFDNPGAYKEAFRRIWDILLPLYRSFNETTRSKGISYEGQVYRELAERVKSESISDILSRQFPHTQRFIFVGLNALNECEKLIMKRMRDAGIAEFCWDYSSSQIRDPHNKSSFFLSANIDQFPQAFTLDPEGLPNPEYHILSIPSSVGQAKQLPSILKRLNASGIETAIVLPDEAQLLPVLNSIPADISDINVTMGYPMRSSSLWSLVGDIADLQLHLRLKGDQWYFYKRQISSILSNSLFKTIANSDDLSAIEALQSERRFFIPASELASTELFALVFKPIITQPSCATPEQIYALEDYLRSIINFIAPRLKECEDMALELDFAREYYLAVTRLRGYSLSVLPATWLSLLDKLVSRAAVPFKGEPLKGLQIMGPLETRALDFDNIVILNANEGIFPRRNTASSFIPPELRRGFGLPTYEYQDAVWAYYFYRMVQRASKVWILFDSRSEGIKGGEQSRYIKQLELHFKSNITYYEAKAPIGKKSEETSIAKTAEDVEIIRSISFSPSSLQSYLDCPAQFYYSKVRKLQTEDELSESMDSGMIGRAFHSTMQEIYTVPDNLVSKTHLQSVLKGDTIKHIVHKYCLEELKSFEIIGRNLIFTDMIERYVRQAIHRDIELLDKMGNDGFKIIGLEQGMNDTIDGFKLYGIIDRLDSLTPGTFRVIDYKTGKVSDNDFKIDDKNAEKIVDKLFNPTSKNRPKIALQLYLYDRFVKKKYPSKRLINSVYQVARLFVKEVEQVELSETFCNLMEKSLKELLEKIADLDTPFSRTSNTRICSYCRYKTICLR